MKNTAFHRFLFLMVLLCSFSVLGCQTTTTTVTDVLVGLADLPQFSLPGGSYDGEQSLTLTSTQGVIHYTLDGTVPTAESPIYGQAILLSADVTVRAIVIATGLDNSPVVGQTYLINLIQSGDAQRGIRVQSGIATIFFAIDVAWVDVHYVINQNNQQNFRMTLNPVTDQYEVELPELLDGDSVIYGFTYMIGTNVTQTNWIVFTSGPVLTPESEVTISEVASDGTIQVTIGVAYAFPVTWVDIHYIVNFGEQQNLRIALNNQTGRYESLILGRASSDSIVYSFTYAKTTGAVNSVWFSHLVGD